MEFKSCSKCGNRKHVSDFYPHIGNPGNVKSSCKECEKGAARLRRQANLSKAREYGRSYYAANRDVLLKAANDNVATPRGKIDAAISSGVSRGIRCGSKCGRRSFALIGYSLDELMSHLEAQFEPWMTWGNYGFYGWHIDHIKPLAAFDYSTPDDPEFKAAWALDNLRPLGAEANWSKGSALIPELYQDNAAPESAETKSAA